MAMKIKRIFTTEKTRATIAELENGKYVAKLNTMELAVCKKVKDGFKVVKTIIGGKMMRDLADFEDCVKMLKDSDFN